MEHIGACHAHAQNPKPAEVTRTAERTASRRRQRRERAHIDSRHRFLSFVARYCATQVVTSICMAPGHTQQVSRRDGAHHQDHARTECSVMASPEDGSELLKPHRPRLSVDGRKHAHCSRRIRFIRFDRRMTSLPHHTALLGDYAVAACSSPYLRTRQWICVRDNPSRRAAFVLFPRHSCRTLAIVVRSSALRSVVSLRDDLAAGCSIR